MLKERGYTALVGDEARGFGGTTERTWARESRFGWREWFVLLAGLMVGMIAIGAAVLTGHWNFVVG